MNKDKYNDMFDYVENLLLKYDSHGGGPKNKINYNRMDHIKRVYNWMLKLYEGYEAKDSIDIDSLKIATIFHDSGYNEIERGNHALVGADICRKYLLEHDYSLEKINFICNLIKCHSDKASLMDNIPIELILLIEADLLDDTGAHGVVMDVWVEALSDNTTFESMLKHIESYTYKLMQINPMRTATAIEIWNEKTKLTNEFYRQYKDDLAN
jgi:uncharacterized protein